MKRSNNCCARLAVPVGILLESDSDGCGWAHGSYRIYVPGAIAPTVLAQVRARRDPGGVQGWSVPAGSRARDAPWASPDSAVGRRRMRAVPAYRDGPPGRCRVYAAAWITIPRRRMLAAAAWSRLCMVPNRRQWARVVVANVAIVFGLLKLLLPA